MANPWDNDPIIKPAASAAPPAPTGGDDQPWLKDPLVKAAPVTKDDNGGNSRALTQTEYDAQPWYKKVGGPKAGEDPKAFKEEVEGADSPFPDVLPTTVGLKTLTKLGQAPVETLVEGAKGAGKAIAGTAERAVNAIKAPFEGLSTGGQEKIVGTTLRNATTKPEQAIANLKSSKPPLPGSTTTTGPASKDNALLGVEKQARAMAPARFADEKLAPANLARTGALEKLAGTPETLAASRDARNAQAKELYAPVFDKFVNVDSKFRDLMKRPSVQTAIKRAQTLAEEDGEKLKQGVDVPAPTIGPATGSSVGQYTGPGTRPSSKMQVSGKGLHYMKMALDAGIKEDTAQGIAAVSNLKKTKTKDEMLDWIDQRIPEYAKARENYALMSRDVNKQKILQKIQAGPAIGEQTDVEGNRIMQRAPFNKAIRAAMPDLEKNMAPEELAQLQRISKDLDQGEKINSPLIRPSGSETFQNQTGAHILGAALGKGVAHSRLAQSTIMRPLNWLYKVPDQQMRELLIDAMLDPKLAARLMDKATPKNLEGISTGLQKLLPSLPVPGAVAAGLDSTSPDQQGQP